MFFYLETYKSNNLEFFNKAKKLIDENNKNSGWQYIIQSLEVDITHKPTLDLALKIMIEEKCYDSALMLMKDYLSIEIMV